MKSVGELKLLRKFVERLGLSTQEQHVYTMLVERGTATVLVLARASGVNRTTCYRIVERLKSALLVEEIVDEHRVLYRASGPHILEQLVKEREGETKMLRDLLPSIAPLVGSVTENSQPGTKVLFYRGTGGIKQMIWNVLRVKREGMGYTVMPIEDVVGVEFAQEFCDEWIRRDLVFRDIISDTYLKYRDKQQVDFDEEHFPSRYVSPEILTITHQIDIYNDVVSYYSWHEGEVFGVEIYNEKIAAMHQQLFEIVWKMGKKNFS